MWAVEDKASKSEIEAQIDTMAIEIQFSRYVLRLRGWKEIEPLRRLPGALIV